RPWRPWPPADPTTSLKVRISLASKPSSSLRPERSRQQSFNRGADGHVTAQDRRNCIRYRHIDVLRSRQFGQHRRGKLAFGQSIAWRLFAAAERDTEREVARLRARTGQDQIAQTRKSGQGFAARTAGASEPHQLGK